MSRRALPFLLALAFAPAARAEGLSPEEAVKRMKLPPGFTARVVAAEPMIRQPVGIGFDARGRMWVMQYLQYPNYAGLKALKQDQYLRTTWDRVPEPPPRGPKGADRLTICSDPDENGVYRKSHDFLTGLNIASGFCLGNGGVYVLQAPYLLFYPDKNEDDVPDGDPEVLLTGFGTEDTHALANSLQWGPDGWLYGAAGSTSTSKIKTPADAQSAPIEFQQGVWRYHPATKRFELFSEGGGNTWGLDFDRNGQAIAGTNWGGFACLHQMQGAYYVKGFAKHGPLHNAHTYGYFDHVPYKGFKGGHVTCGGIVYQADAFPPEYRDQYLAANLLSNAVYRHRLEPGGSSFKASHGGELLETDDPWFRPIDLLQGPDGSVFVVDWYDRRANHVDPVDNWDKANGRVYKIEYQGTPKVPAFDLRKKTSAELVELLKHPNKWWRNEARRLLAERRDKSVYPALRKGAKEEKGTLALEALWALYVSGGWDEAFSHELLAHPDEYVRAWAIRLAGDAGTLEDSQAWLLLTCSESSPVVLGQMACSAKRVAPQEAIAIAQALVRNKVVATDPQLPLLVWWAVEHAMSTDPYLGARFAFSPANQSPLYRQLVEHVTRRLMAPDSPIKGEQAVVDLLDLWNADPKPVLAGIAKSLDGKRADSIQKPLAVALAALRRSRPNDEQLAEIMARLNDPAAVQLYMDRVSNEALPNAARLKAITLLKQVLRPEVKERFLTQFAGAKSDALRLGLLAGLEAFDDPKVGTQVLAAYPTYSAATKKRAVQLLLSRPAWALALVAAVEKGTIPKADITLDHARAAVSLGDKELTARVEKLFGKLAPATAGEKQARIVSLNSILSRNKSADPVKGKALFTKHCAACHQFHGEGGKVGPDLTTADRKNRPYMIAQVVDPSGYIRPEFVVQSVVTLDGRRLSGIAAEGAGESVTLTSVVNDQPQKTTVPKGDIETMAASAVSLMPEKLLDALTDAEIGDLFAYLAADAPRVVPGAAPPAAPKAKKLTVCLVSGSFEYKSDESLAAFQKYLDANFPVACTRAFAKSETEIAGLENLDSADVAVFFTRRLKLPAADVDRVKKFVQSGKPVVGIRTASHGFQGWLEMDKVVFGGDYKNHYGAGPVCEVRVAEKGKDHPVLAGVRPFRSTGSLYKNPAVAADVTVLLTGTIPMHTEPVAWVRETAGRRTFYTSLGHPDDFKDENFVRLLVNALAWASKTELKPAK